MNADGLKVLKREFFITDKEYGKMLYANPRGISCKLCHGDNGEPKVIVSYQNLDGETIAISTPKISHLPLGVFKDALLKKTSRSVMPTYALTQTEINAIYTYLKKDDNVTRE